MLKRRIVLEDSQIVSRTVPEPPKVKKTTYDLGWDTLGWDEGECLPTRRREIMQRDFEKLSAIGAQDIRCPFCKSPNFDTNLMERTIDCLGCRRRISFEVFFEEHR